jgi:two-component system NtrC family sensor kinase
MQPLADAASELPWLAPCADSLVTLARGAGAKAWSELRSDPGLVLLLLRAAGLDGSASALPFYSALLREPAPLDLALDHLSQRRGGFVDWSGSLLAIYRAAQTIARTAEAIAVQSDRCDVDHAFVGGLLAPLGWLAAAAVDPQATELALRELASHEHIGEIQNRLWGRDAPAIARRLAVSWALPAWLTAIAGHLALPVDVAATLGADPDQFLVVQLAVSLTNQAGLGLNMQIGASGHELAAAVDLPSAALEQIQADVPRFANYGRPPATWSSPSGVALLADLLRLGLENRRGPGRTSLEHFNTRVDALHNGLARHKASEYQRLHESKLRAMAELAAGAGHEINNPLAVISGQAQYLLLSEQEPARRKALQTIVGQSQRIHQVLTGLMQFARPPAPDKQPVDLGGLVRDVLGTLQPLAEERQVQLQGPETLPLLTLLVDAGQIRTALTALVRNAIEAPPAAGWARLCVDQPPDGGLLFVVEDSGPGPGTADREHLFDPFYSGRKAGRGQGLGLATAWQLARQHDGEVRFHSDGPTRFLLELPAGAICAPGRNGYRDPPPQGQGEPATQAAQGLVLLAASGNGIPSPG